MKGKRLLALAALVVALIVAGAAPAFAHATLLTTDPQPGGKFDTSPREISLRFNEPVEVSLGGIRLYDARERRIDIGEPEHPNGEGNRVARVDAEGRRRHVRRHLAGDLGRRAPGAGRVHVPGRREGIGEERRRARQASPREPGREHDRRRGVRDRPGRALRHARAAHRRHRVPVGGVPGRTRLAARAADRLGRLDRRRSSRRLPASRSRASTRRRCRSPRSSTPPCSATCSTRGTGACRSCASGCSCSLFPLLRVLLSRHPASEHPLRKWWLASAGVLAVGLSLTPGLAGHAGTGDYTGLRHSRRRHPRAGDGLLAGRAGDAPRRRAPAHRSATSCGRGSTGTPRSRSARSSRWSSPAVSRHGARWAASPRCVTPTTASC